MFDDIQPNQQFNPDSSQSNSSQKERHTIRSSVNPSIASSAKESQTATSPSGEKTALSATSESKSPVVKPSSPTEKPEDIFSDVDGADSTPLPDDYSTKLPDTKLISELKQKENGEVEMPGLISEQKSKIKITLIILIVILAAIVIAWLIYVFAFSLKTDTTVKKTGINKSIGLPESEEVSGERQNLNINANASIKLTQPVDTDGDGLIDDDEIKFGTNPKLKDTDNDGLFDQDEIIKYKTDPNNDDTDGDNYSDGEEVENGYNPLGAGRLIDKIELP